MAVNETTQANLLQNAQEVAATECHVKGVVPSWLNGHLIRNGPGEFDIGKSTFRHWFDGHAFLHKFEISNGNVVYSGKYIESHNYKTNKKHNKIVEAGFGTPSLPDPCKSFFQRFFAKFISESPVFDNCNVNIANLGEAYYALTDAGVLFRIDPTSLDAQNFFDLSKSLGTIGSTAHPHYDSNGDYLNVATCFGKDGYYCITRVPASSMHKEDPMNDLEITTKINMDNSLNPCYFHSFALSENYIALHDQTVRYNTLKLLKLKFTWGGVLDAMEHNPNRDSVFHVIDKKTNAKLPIRFKSKGRFCFHHINSFEVNTDDQSFLVIDMFCSDGPSIFWFWLKMLRDNSEDLKKSPRMMPLRFVLPLHIDEKTPKGTNLIGLPGYQATAVLQDDGSVFLTPELLVQDDFREKVGCLGFELPSINYELYNEKPYKYLYCVGEDIGLPNQLIKINVETKEAIKWKEENYYPSEPVFVRKPGSTEEDDGVILSTVISNKLQDPVILLVLDAKTFQEIARAEIKTTVPYPLHGRFTMQSNVGLETSVIQ